MDEIPITFDHQGKKFTGYFSKVAGAGASSMWQLMDEKNYYCGRLRDSDKWIFDAGPKTEKLAEVAEYFGDYITAWYQ